MKTSPFVRGLVMMALLAGVPASSKNFFAPANAADMPAPPPPPPSPPGIAPASSIPPASAIGVKGIRFGAGTTESLQVAQTEISRFSTNLVSDPSKLEINGPLVSYTDGGGLANGRGLRSANLTGYYYLVEDAGAFVAGLNVSDASPFLGGPLGAPARGNAPSGALRVQSQDRGPRGTGAILEGALAKLATLDQMQAGSFEARLLRVEWLGNQGRGRISSDQELATQSTPVLWLKSDPGGADLIYLFGTSPNQALVAGKLYSVADFQGALQSFAQPVPLTKEMIGASTIKQPKAAARAALDLVQATRQDADYASPVTHPALLSDLNVLESLAKAIINDDAKDPPATAKLLDDFSLALAQAVSRVGGLARRSAETPDARDKSLALEAKLREIQNQ